MSDRPRPVSRRVLPVVLACGLVAIAAGAVRFATAREPDPSAPAASRSQPAGTTSPGAPPTPTPELTLTLRHLSGRRIAPGSVPPARLAGAAAGVRSTLTDLYRAGFVEREELDAGMLDRFEDLFLLRTRPRVERDLGSLTLPAALARRLDGVRPRASTLDVRFLVHRFPVLAVATVAFRATGQAGPAEVPLRHDGTYTLRRTEGGWRIAAYRVRGRLPSVEDVDATVREAAASPGLAATGPYVVLAIGSDARPGQGPSGTRADSLHLVAVNPALGTVSILGIPRDSYVPIPGIGTRKINESLVRGGPELVVRTVEAVSGVSIDGYVLTGFAGLRGLIDAVGGVELHVPRTMNDPYSGARFSPGIARLNGRRALAFARDRHDVPGGDFGRSLNQGRLMVAALRELGRDVARDPAAMLRWIAAGERILRTDLTLSEIADLLLAVPSVDPARIVNRVVPGTVGTVGGLSIVRLGSGAREVFRDLAADAVLDGRP
jgi:LCP family protein required for cell wall assembly